MYEVQSNQSHALHSRKNFLPDSDARWCSKRTTMFAKSPMRKSQEGERTGNSLDRNGA
jgi:hypothetical protein